MPQQIELQPVDEATRESEAQYHSDRQTQLSPEAEGLKKALAMGPAYASAYVGSLPPDKQASVAAEIKQYDESQQRMQQQDAAAQHAQYEDAKQLHWADPGRVRDAANMSSLPDWQKRIQGQVDSLNAQQAPQMQAAQLGAAPTMQAAQLGPAAQAQAAQIATQPQGQWRDQQMGLAQTLSQAASGQGPSAAQAQLKSATDRNMGQALALALAARGGDQAGAMKQAQMQRALISQDAGNQSAMLRAQEQQQAQQALGSLLAQGRGQDIGLATDQAGLQQQTALSNQNATNQFGLQQGTFNQQANASNLDVASQFGLQQGAFNQQANQANLGATLAQRQMVADKVQQYTAMGMNGDMAQQQAKLDTERYLASLQNQQELSRFAIGDANTDKWLQAAGAMMQAGSSMMGFGATGGK